MAVSIGSNISAQRAIRRVGEASVQFGRAANKLSTGSRINTAADDAAGLSIAMNLRARIRVYTQGVRNANDSISALNIAQGGVDELTSILIRLKELATQSSNGIYTRQQRNPIDGEAAALVKEYNRLIATTDFNGQKLLDATTGNIASQLGFGSDGTIAFNAANSLQRVVGSGSFGTNNSSGLFNVNQQAAAEDINGDGKLDIIGSNTGTNAIVIQLGNGDGTFQTQSFITTNTATYGVAVADFNGDGKLDVAAGEFDGTIQIFNGNGTGSFSSGATITVDAGTPITNLKVGDFNGDGKNDLAFSSFSTNRFSILQNNGTGNFTSTQYTASSNIAFLDTGDIDGDGKSDVVLSSSTAASGQVFRSTGNSLVLKNTLSLTNAFETIDINDINHDGRGDIITTRGNLYTGNADGTVTAKPTLNLNNGSAQFADINKDGNLDIIHDNLTVKTVYFGNGDATFAGVITSSGAASPSGLFVLADFNRDGALDSYNIHGGGPSLSLGGTAQTTNEQRFDLSTRESSLSALDLIDAALQRVQKTIGDIGASQSRLSIGLRVLGTFAENSASAEGRISDADIAQESAALVKSRILQSVASSVLAQANTEPELALQLLRF